MLFFVGLFLGAFSGCVTYGFTEDTGMSLAVGAIAAALTWCRVHTLIFVFLDD